jgi:hypothetical protein
MLWLVVVILRVLTLFLLTTLAGDLSHVMPDDTTADSTGHAMMHEVACNAADNSALDTTFGMGWSRTERAEGRADEYRDSNQLLHKKTSEDVNNVMRACLKT